MAADNARYLLDSNIVILLLKAQVPEVAQRMAAETPDAFVTSAICMSEVRIRLSDDERARLGPFLERVPILPYDDAAARSYATLPFKRGSFDRLITAHALALNLTVITANEKDFADVPGLRVENWMAG